MKRALGKLTRDDLGKHIVFKAIYGKHVEGTLRSFSQGIYSNTAKGEVDVPLTLVSVYAARSHESHWGTPETIAQLTNEGAQQHG